MDNLPEGPHKKKTAPSQNTQSLRLRALELENEALKSQIGELMYEKIELTDAITDYKQS